jgi:hypothetical protein
LPVKHWVGCLLQVPENSDKGTVDILFQAKQQFGTDSIRFFGRIKHEVRFELRPVQSFFEQIIGKFTSGTDQLCPL